MIAFNPVAAPAKQLVLHPNVLGLPIHFLFGLPCPGRGRLHLSHAAIQWNSYHILSIF